MKPYKPHPYQRAMIKFGVGLATAGFFADPGLGKTSVMLAIFKILRKMNLVTRMLVIAPLRPCYSVWSGPSGEPNKWDDFRSLKVAVLHGPDKGDRLAALDADIYVINPEGLPWLTANAPEEWPFPMLTVDECFPAGTMIDTPSGTRPVEALRPGDLVHTDAGLREVLKLGTRQADELVKLHLSDGRALACTREHPIFTDVGWVPAALCEGRDVYARSGMPALQAKVHADEVWATVLFKILRSEDDVGELQPEEAGARKGSYERGQPWAAVVEQGKAVASGALQEDLRASQSVGAWFREAWGKWYGHDDLRGACGRGFAERVAVELRGRVGWEAARLSYMLQAGLREQEVENRNRGGWREPPTSRASQAGSQEGASTGRIRVVRVEDIQRSGTTVYNLRVEGCPHFFAEGVLVHNSTRFKHANTLRFKKLVKILNKFDRRYILTGSPAPNGLLDLFGQIFILDGGAALGKFISHYRMNYFDATGYGGYTWIPRPGADKKIYAKLKPLVLRMAAEDYLDMEPYVANTVEVILPDKARKIYDQMERTLITAVEEEVVTAANAAAATGKCRQIANGGIYQGDGEKRASLAVHEAKLDAVEEIIEELSGKPALVAYEFDHDRERLLGRLGKDTPYIGGGVSAKRFKEIEVAWNAGKIPILLAQPQSVAWGLNLQGVGSAVIWHSLTWDLEGYEQLIRRVWRQGQRERIVVHHIVAKDTIDEAMMKCLIKKDQVQRSLLDALKGYVRSRLKKS